ncbi:MAG: hypothetical protein HOP19_21600, partial [Acidobacteria bacterium]|nr:hypothetical protein [Acidobacteriota bacterium]
MQNVLRFIALFALCCLPLITFAQGKLWKDYLGKWDISGEAPHQNYVYWLEVKEVDGKLAADFLNRGGSVLPVSEIRFENGELIFRAARANERAPQ